jgi:hypothetical protein
MEAPLQIVSVFVVAIFVLPLATNHSFAQMRAGPAPQGNAVVVAQRVIQDNFDEATCPLVTKANRLGDGSISAVCNTGERFRVFSMRAKGPMAVKCSEVARMGVAGC